MNLKDGLSVKICILLFNMLPTSYNGFEEIHTTFNI
jgi:hypothetical protein